MSTTSASAPNSCESRPASSSPPKPAPSTTTRATSTPSVGSSASLVRRALSAAECDDRGHPLDEVGLGERDRPRDRDLQHDDDRDEHDLPAPVAARHERDRE